MTHRLKLFNLWSQVSTTLWEGSGSAALLKEMHHRKKALRGPSFTSLLTCFLWVMCVIEGVIFQILASAAMSAVSALFLYHDRFLFFQNHTAKQSLIYSMLLAMMF